MEIEAMGPLQDLDAVGQDRPRIGLVAGTRQDSHNVVQKVVSGLLRVPQEQIRCVRCVWQASFRVQHVFQRRIKWRARHGQGGIMPGGEPAGREGQHKKACHRVPRAVPRDLVSNIGRRAHGHIERACQGVWCLRAVMRKGQRAAEGVAGGRGLQVRRWLRDGAREWEDSVEDSSLRRHLSFSIGALA